MESVLPMSEMRELEETDHLRRGNACPIYLPKADISEEHAHVEQ
jgi:hypothetical protein